MSNHPISSDQLAPVHAAFSAVLANSPDAIITETTDGTITSWNKGAEVLFGYLGSEVIGRHVSILAPPEHSADVAHIIERVKKGEVVKRAAVDRIRKDGNRFTVSLAVCPILNSEGQVIGFTKIAHDITAQLQSLADLKESEERLRLQSAALKSAANAIVITDRNGTISWVNPAFSQLTGYSEQEAVGSTPRVLKSETQSKEFYQNMWATILSGKVWHGQLINKRKNGTLYHEEMTITPVPDATGAVAHFIAIKQDITDRKHAEEALLLAREQLSQANAQLEKKVEDRTTQLVEANTHLQAFTYTAAHDMRSPLRSIKGFSSMLKKSASEKLTHEEKSLLERVLGSASQMEHLLNDLLEYSRINTEKLDVKPLDLSKAVQDALLLVENEINARNAQVTLVEPFPIVIGHHTTLVLLISNFLSNGLKFMNTGVQPRLRIFAEDLGDSVRLNVEDNGIGIAQEDLNRIFDAFERLHDRRAYPGTGLGLAIVRKAAERMGGHTGVRSELGKGSCFWVQIRKGQPLPSCNPPPLPVQSS